MSRTPTTRSFLLILLLLCATLPGCLEDEVELTLNADGSGTLEQTVTLSDRLIVAATAEEPSGDGPGSDVPLDEAQLREQVGDALTIEQITAEDLPDGGRRITLRGTFDDAAAFFRSEYANELKLKLETVDDDTAAIAWSTSVTGGESGGGPDISLAQLYGLAKGMHVRRTLHLPAAIQSEAGEIGGDGRSVTWAIDLRDREALARTQAFVDEHPKQVRAAFPRSAVAIDYASLDAAAPAGKTASADGGAAPVVVAGDAAGLEAQVAGIVVSRARQLVELSDGSAPEGGLAIELLLTWPEGAKPLAYEDPVITSLADDRGNDLVPEETGHSFRREFWEHDENKRLSLTAGAPAKDAAALVGLAGYIPVVAGAQTSEVELSDPLALAGKDETGTPALDALGVRIESVDDQQVQVEANGDRIAEATLVKAGGERVAANSRSSWSMGERHTYSFGFESPVEPGDKLVLTIRESETVVNVPFAAERIELP